MTIDHEYANGLLGAFQKAEREFTNIEELKLNGYSNEDDRFILHLNYLHEQGLIKGYNGKSPLGYRIGADDKVTWAVVPLRLTAAGHDYIARLNESGG